jgi:DNA polymerase (family X)
MDNRELARLLDDWADILDLEEQTGYKSRAYRKAAHNLAGWPEPVEAMVRSGRDLRAIPGIGPGIEGRIRTILQEGKWARLEEARSRHGLDKVQEERRAPRKGLAALVKGDLHSHTNATDGRDSLEQMVAAARQRGHEYVAITDHSQETRVAGGLSEEKMRIHMARIRRFAESVEGIRVLAGAEVDILRDGRLDFPDPLLKDLDVVLCSVHFRHKLDGAQQTERILRGMSNDHADIYTHPTGRRTGIRPGMDIDLDRIAEAARDQGWAIEMNGSPERRDLDAAGGAKVVAAGARVVLDSDAHATSEYDNVRYAAREAEKAGIQAEQVLNCRAWREFRRKLRSG